METLDREGYTAILWEGREYVPWGMVSDGRGKQVGYVDGDEKKRFMHTMAKARSSGL